MSATTIIGTAPLGALIRYTDGSPEIACALHQELAAWERSNGIGRLVKKEPPRPYPTWTAPASFTLHEGNFSSDGVILVTIMRSHSADSALTFDVVEVPRPGQVKILLDFGGATELLHLAANETAARALDRQGRLSQCKAGSGRRQRRRQGRGGEPRRLSLNDRSLRPAQWRRSPKMTLSPKEGQGAIGPVPVSSARTFILAASLAGVCRAGPSAPVARAPSPASIRCPWSDPSL